MATERPDRGMQSVPRGLPSDLTVYLQSLDAVVRRLAGLARGSEKSQAVRRGDTGIALGGSAQTAVTSARLADGAVITSKLANGAVTGAKLADGSITGSKLELGSIGSRELGAGCVGEEELQAGAVTVSRLAEGAVTLEKMAPEAMPVMVHGRAVHGEMVNTGVWHTAPVVWVTGFSVPSGATGELHINVENMRMEAGSWLFDAIACVQVDAMTSVPGELCWCVLGWKKEA